MDDEKHTKYTHKVSKMLVFPLFNSMAPDGSMEGCTNEQTNGGTKLLIELRVRNLS